MSEWTVGWLRTPSGEVPARQFLDRLPSTVASQIMAVVKAVRDAPPPSFRGGGKWEAMRDEMSGFYEVRVRHSQDLYRLFCILDRNGPEGPTLLLVVGGKKRTGTRMDAAVYALARSLRSIYQAAPHRAVEYDNS